MNKKHSPPSSASANKLSPSQRSQQPHVPTKSHSQQSSHTQSSPQTQQSQSLNAWSSHTLLSGQWSSQNSYSLPTNATAAGDLFLFFGGGTTSHNTNDIYVISTRDYSTTLLPTCGDVPKPRYGHCAVLISTDTFLIWGGTDDGFLSNLCGVGMDDKLYLLNFVSREWTRIVIKGPGPSGRYLHTLTLVGSQIFVFGGRTHNSHFNDIWALDLNYVKSGPSWESYEPATRKEKPLPRAGHVSVTIDDRIIVFGGHGSHHSFNDTWSFNILTRKWTELRCTGSIPSPGESHAAVLIHDTMYVFGGRARGGAFLGGLTALNLTTQRWTAFQDTGLSPSGRSGHTMACDGTRVFVLGGIVSPGSQVDQAGLIHVLDTKLLLYPECDPNTVNHSEKITQLVQKPSAGDPTQGQSQQEIFSSSGVGVAHGAFPFQIATPEDLRSPASPPVTRKRNPNLNARPPRSTGASCRPRRVPGEDEAGEGSTGHVKRVVPEAPSRRELTQLEDGRLVALERQLSEVLVAKTERDRCIGQLTEELALKSAQLVQVAEGKKRAGVELRELQAKFEQAEANATEEKTRAGLELRELQAKLNELLLSRDHTLKRAEAIVAEKKYAELKLRELQAKFEQAEANATEEKTRAGLELRELQAKLNELLLSHNHTLKRAEAVVAEKKYAELKLRELQAKLDESLLSRDHALEQSQSALQKAACVAEADEQSQRELAQMRVELEASKSESATLRMRLADTENGSESKAEADTYRTPTATSPVNTEVDRVVQRLMERMQAMEAEMASLRWNEKSFETMECRNED